MPNQRGWGSVRIRRNDPDPLRSSFLTCRKSMAREVQKTFAGTHPVPSAKSLFKIFGTGLMVSGSWYSGIKVFQLLWLVSGSTGFLVPAFCQALGLGKGALPNDKPQWLDKIHFAPGWDATRKCWGMLGQTTSNIFIPTPLNLWNWGRGVNWNWGPPPLMPDPPPPPLCLMVGWGIFVQMPLKFRLSLVF